MMTFVLKKNETPVLTKQQHAHQQLRNAILSGAVKPGERIVIDTVAQELGMSPIPVREAITQLAREGLLTIRPHAGAVVSDIPKHAIEEIFALMEALEMAASRLALPDLTKAHIDELEGMCAEMETVKTAADWAQLNRRFHEAIPRLAGLGRFEELLVRAGEDWERLRMLRFAEVRAEDIALANREHREFITLLREGKLRPVEKWIREHNRNALKRYLAY